MDSSLDTTLKPLADQMARMNQDLTNQLAQTNQSMTCVNIKLDQLEAREPRRTQIIVEPEPAYDPNLRRAHYEPNPRRSNPEFMDQDERAIRNKKLEASSFRGDDDPKAYLDWERDMD